MNSVQDTLKGVLEIRDGMLLFCELLWAIGKAPFVQNRRREMRAFGGRTMGEQSSTTMESPCARPFEGAAMLVYC